jgi:hypothetical protein
MKSLVIPRLLAPKYCQHFKMLYYHNITENLRMYHPTYRSWKNRIKLLHRIFCGDVYTQEFLQLLTEKEMF